MSVYRFANSPYYYFDFQHRGRRFHGSTGTANKREAERFEAAKRDEARALMAAEAATGQPAAKGMTVHEALARYWTEVGQHAATSDDIWGHLRRLEQAFGKQTLLSEITTNKVALEVGRRRSDGVKPATVNRTLTEPLRRVLRRAEKVWEQKLRPIDWQQLLLPEPRERIREASEDEEARLLDALRPDYRPIVEFMLATGCRLEEAVGLTWARVYWAAGYVEIHGKGSRGVEEKIRPIPITDRVREILWPIRNDHPEAVFAYVVKRTDKAAGIARGDRLPIQYEGLKTEWQRARERAGVTDFRLHDLRHTCLTRLVRQTGNLKLAQKLAGHSEIATTARYAHATLDDLRAGMEIADTKSQTNSQTGARRAAK